MITQPQRDFTQFVEACFGPFAASLAKTKDPYKSLEKEAKDLIAVLHEKLDRRRKNLQTGLGMVVRSKIKLTTFDLKVITQIRSSTLANDAERAVPLTNRWSYNKGP